MNVTQVVLFKKKKSLFEAAAPVSTNDEHSSGWSQPQLIVLKKMLLKDMKDVQCLV